MALAPLPTAHQQGMVSVSLARTQGDRTSPMVVLQSTSRRLCEYCSAPEVGEAALTDRVAVEVGAGLLVSGVARRAV
ncbi:MAG: hypothetical protein L0H96_22450 [Humibacillus sp.]|nr:hypothetical protein [Humibacillus sp.]